MSRIDESIEVNVPVAMAYEQWIQFEQFPRFMEGVDRVERIDDVTHEWTATIGGQTKHWRSRIVELVPGARIGWASTGGSRNDGTVLFSVLDPARTRIDLEMDVETDGVVESIGDALGIVRARVRGDLERFRDLMEGSNVADANRTNGAATAAATAATGSVSGIDPRAHTAGVGFARGSAEQPLGPDVEPGTGQGFARGSEAHVLGSEVEPGTGQGFARGSEANVLGSEVEPGTGKGFARTDADRDSEPDLDPHREPVASGSQAAGQPAPGTPASGRDLFDA